MPVEVPTVEDLTEIAERVTELESDVMPENVKTALVTILENAAVVVEWLKTEAGG